MKNIFFILLFSLPLWLVGCAGDDTENPAAKLPPETQTGANTFGCLINGTVLIPRDGPGSVMGQDSGFVFWGDPTDNEQFNEIDIHDFKSQRTGSILVHIQNLRQLGVGEYRVDESNGMNSIDGYMHNYIYCRVFNKKTNLYQYYRSYHNSGLLKITRFDWYDGIISGNFECSAVNSANSNDTIDIKSGRFDFDGYTLPSTEFP